MKRMIKKLVFGAEGNHKRAIRRGLLKGLSFMVDSRDKAQRLIGLDEREIAKALLACRAALDDVAPD